MPTKSILVNFNSSLSSIDSLMPDNGLANLAGSLLDDGHETLILDFCTVDIIKRMFPDRIRMELGGIYGSLMMDMKSGRELGKEAVENLIRLDNELEENKQAQVASIANEIFEEACRIGADFIGFKLWTGDGFSYSVKIAEQIKKRIPHVKLFAGGPHVDCFMENILDYTDVFDALAYGEGEETIKLLADYAIGKTELPDIPNIIYKNGKVNVTRQKRISQLDSLPDPVYDDRIYPAMLGDQKIKFIMIDESRGCPYACYFCIHPKKSGSKWRRRNPFKVVDLIEKLSHQLNTNAFRLAGSNTPVDLMNDLASELIKRQVSIGYAAFGHVRESENYELLQKSGCLSLLFGVESGSQFILDKDINKKVKVNQIMSALKGCKQAEILTVASIVAPCPHDTDDTIKETLNLLIETKPDSVTIQLPFLIPGAYWYENRKDFSFEIHDDFLQKLMTYHVKLLLPPILWEPLPYTMGNMEQHQSVMLAQNLAGELEKNGILTGIGDLLQLIGKYLHVPAREIRDKNRELFFTGDYPEIQNIVKSFNSQVKNHDSE